MSVRNILDGTIKVGSGEVMPVEPEIPENLQVVTLKALGSVTGTNVYAIDTLMVGNSRGNTTITPATVTASNVTADKLTLGGSDVLTKEFLSDKIIVSGVKADGKTTVSFDTQTNRWLHNFYPNLHLLLMNLNLTTEPLSQLTIPTGLTCGKGTMWMCKTLLKTDNEQYIDCVTLLNESGGKLVIKIDIPTASSYAGLQIRLAIPFQ